MTSQASFTLRGRNPDVLICIANLSSDVALLKILPVHGHDIYTSVQSSRDLLGFDNRLSAARGS